MVLKLELPPEPCIESVPVPDNGEAGEVVPDQPTRL
jgi:hypothetical protein